MSPYEIQIADGVETAVANSVAKQTAASTTIVLLHGLPMSTIKPQDAYHYTIAWWNVGNLFDADTVSRTPELRSLISKELTGWTEELRDNKIANLSRIISSFQGGKGVITVFVSISISNWAGPDILGVCEVENRHVVELLVARLASSFPARSYAIAHADSPDKRGIDVAFIYDSNTFTAEHQFSLQLVKRSPTRDLFQVNFRVNATKRLLIVIGNHWPSRRGGSLESEPYRILAAETLSYWLSRIQSICGSDAAVVCVVRCNRGCAVIDLRR